LSSAHVVLTES